MNVAAKPDQRGTQLRALDMAGCVFQLMQAQGLPVAGLAVAGMLAGQQPDAPDPDAT